MVFTESCGPFNASTAAFCAIDVGFEVEWLARLGGDEFVVLLMEVGDRKQVAAVARKIVAAVGQPFVLHGQECAVGASIGIAVYPDDGRDEQTLTKNADAAMYQTKVGGRNGFHFFTAELHDSANERLALETALRHALGRHEMRLHYQAKRAMRGGRITGMEALLRWKHPELGTIAPEEFLAIAEETGVILPIGRWAIRAACLQNLAWQREGLPHLSVSLNLSAQQFASVNLHSDVAAILSETGLAPQCLELEVDESILMRDVDSAMHTLTRLRDLGVRVGIDRFGAGYSTLSNLGRFPVDTIKIDRSCIRGIVESVSDRKLTDAIIALGRTLSVNVVGHGVETQEQADVLRNQSCPELQGYYFDRPLPAAEFAKLLAAEKA
jgi:predicted signal transduction protein with EAL and GGDEF domain